MMKDINIKRNYVGYINSSMLTYILSKPNQRRTERFYIISDSNFLEGF